MLEQLIPAERAVFVLREVFITVIARSPRPWSAHQPTPAARIAEPPIGYGKHGRGSTRTARSGTNWSSGFWPQRGGDLTELERLLAADVVSWSDGGGQASAARHPAVGSARVGRLVAGLVRKADNDAVVSVRELNGGPALLAPANGHLFAAMAPPIVGGEDRRVALRRSPSVSARSTCMLSASSTLLDQDHIAQPCTVIYREASPRRERFGVGSAMA